MTGGLWGAATVDIPSSATTRRSVAKILLVNTQNLGKCLCHNWLGPKLVNSLVNHW